MWRLGVGVVETGDMADQKPGISIALNDRGERRFHALIVSRGDLGR